MITAPKERDAHLPSTWTTAICLAVLTVGIHGATYPVVPPVEMVVALDTGDSVDLEEFEPPPPGPAEPEEQVEEEIIEEVEIPPLPELQAPLTPPEMTEILPLEEIQQPPPPVAKPPAPKPEPQKPKPVARRPTSAPSQNAGSGTGNSNGSGAPTLFTRSGGGRFPHPSYPSSARSAKQQGTVRLIVTVEPSGLPGAVSVQSSSGFPALDSAASDHVRRRWRWPSGDMRRFIVPVRFVLQ